MGEMAEDSLYDFEEDEAPLAFAHHPEPDAKVWVTKDGDHIQIVKMGDAHLANTLNYLEGIGSTADGKIDYLLAEAARRQFQKMGSKWKPFAKKPEGAWKVKISAEELKERF